MFKELIETKTKTKSHEPFLPKSVSVILFSMIFLQEVLKMQSARRQDIFKQPIRISQNFSLDSYCIVSLLLPPSSRHNLFSYCPQTHKENHFLSNTNAKRQRKPIRIERHIWQTICSFDVCDMVEVKRQQRNTNTIACVSQIEK